MHNIHKVMPVNLGFYASFPILSHYTFISAIDNFSHAMPSSLNGTNWLAVGKIQKTKPSVAIIYIPTDGIKPVHI